MATLLSQVSWPEVNERVHHEQRNREVYVPPISLYRWWARRPNALIGALMDAAATEDSIFVSDPFSGGGTVAMEAARRGFPLIAQDLHPWAIAGLAAALDRVSVKQLRNAVDGVLEATQARTDELYAAPCSEHLDQPSEVSHVFWARTVPCPECSRLHYLYPYSLLTLASRQSAEAVGFFGCSACGAVTKGGIDAIVECEGCSRVLPARDVPLLGGRRATCVGDGGCGASFSVFAGERPGWEEVLVARTCASPDGVIHHFEVRPSLPAVRAPESPAPLQEAIPAGLETSLLTRAGFEVWSDILPARQLVTLTTAARAVDELDCSEVVKARLRLAICGAVEMAGFLSRWDRYYPKAFEATANHRFPALGLACETNLVAARGRGTIHRRMAQTIKAAEWAHQNFLLEGTIRQATSTDKRRAVGSGAVLVAGSSERQIGSTESVDLVLTDPPYFDDVQYSELASLFLVAARSFGLLPETVKIESRSEAVSNHMRGQGVDEYQELLSRILTEAARTLKPDGRLVLTFHNTDLRAWWALGNALRNAGFNVQSIAVAQAENSSDHPKRTTKAFTTDLVFECATRAPRPGPEIASAGEDQQSDELLAAGLTAALDSDRPYDEFARGFLNRRGEVDRPLIRAPRMEER